MIQPFFNGHAPGASLEEGEGASTAELGVRRDDCDLRGFGLLVSFPPSSDESFFSPAALLRSKVAPGVFGVLPVLPNPNAPVPSPKADEAPEPVGEATEEVDRGPIDWKGLCLPWLLRVPNRFAEGGS